MASACPECRGSGFRLMPDEEGVVHSRPCDCRLPELGRLRLREARIPPRYDHCTLEAFEAQHDSQRAARSVITEWLERWPDLEHGLLLHGPPGSGKTHLAVALARELIDKAAVRVLFYEQRELLKSLRGTFDDDAQRESDVFAPILDAELLILDDLGAGRVTAWCQDVLHDIITHRYNRKLPMVLTTNRPLAAAGRDQAPGLEERLGDALMSRLYEMCQILPVEGKFDYRREVRAFQRN